ncbi:hypothetical protein FYK55_17150 [Roseiconus nitratireducens]|uniref:Uncharacterized protein n=1 Tax=Roseiconus nitratireducens TaxID=2605748 RepID=A0A5M6D3L7_9BACT|nr:hypothetical protein [Roseiconus nitratireducens]KAA5541923.1 hypothetical protein FYK55_17150 [Roseiconus nitratireducens]
MRVSVHDNWVYAQSVDHERCHIVLHTVYPHAEPPEYTDILFEGVVVHHFEQQKVGPGPYPANVLFDVKESDPVFMLGQYSELLARTKNHGWPVTRYDGTEDLASQLSAGGAKCFVVHGTCGLHGFVFAASVEFRRRQSRMQVAEAEPADALESASRAVSTMEDRSRRPSDR